MMSIVDMNEEQLVEFRDLALAAAYGIFGVLIDLHASAFDFTERRTHPISRNEPGTYKSAYWASSNQVPLHYTSVIGMAVDYRHEVAYQDVPGVPEYLEFVQGQKTLAQRLVPTYTGADDDAAAKVVAVLAADLPEQIVERHIHTAGWEPNVDLMFDLFRQLASAWLLERLDVEMLVPVLGVDFVTDRLELNDAVRIERLSAQEQLARWPGQQDPQLKFVGMSTHALVLEGWWLPNPGGRHFIAPPGVPEEIPQADLFFQALATVTDSPTGYVHVAYRPIGWADGFIADLPPLIPGSFVQSRRSTRLQQGPEPLDVLGPERLEDLKRAFTALSKDKSARLAAERLVEAEQRHAASDRIVDLCVGLEALLGDGQGELTYKVATRGGALLAHAGVKHVADYMTALKVIYTLRSSMVHGRGSPAKCQSVEVAGATIQTEDVARQVLRLMVATRVAEPQLTPPEIDRVLIGGALTSLANGREAPTWAAWAEHMTRDSAES